MNLTLQYSFEGELSLIAVGIVFVAIIGFIDSRDFLNVLINAEIAMLGINFYIITAAAA